MFTLRIRSVTGLQGVACVEGKWPIFSHRGTVKLGKQFVISGRIFRSEFGAQENGFLSIGDRVYINQGCSIVATSSITIGNDCLIGDCTAIMDSTFHALPGDELPKVEPVTIGNNVWIGRNCLIFPGVSVGDYAVIGSGSVVTKSVPARTLVAGVPAEAIRQLVVKEGWHHP